MLISGLKPRGTTPFILASLLMTTALTMVPERAWAIPSFAAQTNQPCSACHVGAFGPQLKPYGRDFKLYGYVTSDRPKDDDLSERVSVMLKTSFTHTDANQSQPPTTSTNRNDNVVLDQLAMYYGGRITPSIGMIQEMSYDGVNHKFFWDALDVRHAWEGSILGTDYVGGIVVGNQLGNTSIWNSTPPNGFPYNQSGVAPTPAAGTLFDDSLNGQILGPGAYMLWNDWIYAEGNFYFPLGRRVDSVVGNATPNQLTDAIPFWHVAVQHEFFNHRHSFQIGTFGAIADLYPGGITSSGPATLTGPKDHLNDIGVEANYQWLDDLHNMVSAHALYIHESQNLNASNAQGASANRFNHLDEIKADVTYTIDDTYVPSVQYFRTTGSKDPVLYTTTASGSPNTQGYTAELAYVPFGKPDSPGYNWGNVRVGLQYTGYTMFNGTVKHASDNNTLFLSLHFILAPLVPLLRHDDAGATDSNAKKGG